MSDLIDRDEAKKAMTAAVWERAALADASPLQAQLAVRAYSNVLDDLPAASQIVEHDYSPSMNPNDQGECIVCGGGPHTRVCDPRDEVIRQLVEALINASANLETVSRADQLNDVQKQQCRAWSDEALAAARKMKGAVK